MPTIVCINCNVQMKCQKTGVPVELMKEDGPYQLFMGDVYVCSLCDYKVIGAVAGAPVAQHYEPDYQQTRKSYDRSSDGPVIRYWGTLREQEQWKRVVAALDEPSR